MYLAGDVGGTKVNLALCEVHNGTVEVQPGSLIRYSSSDFTSLPDVLRHYLSEAPGVPSHLDGACFGVPGPVLNGRCQTVNLPWVLDANLVATELSDTFSIGFVRIINDLHATAFGLGTLNENHGLVTLRAGGGDCMGNQALIAPGTGLGQAILFWDGEGHVVAPSEGGHADFGPQTEEQVELLRWLWTRHHHVSWEHVAAGPAIYRLYRFLKETGREREPAHLEVEFAKAGVDPSPIIAAHAIKGDQPICVRTMDLWMYCLGAEAGNLALKALSVDGLFIGGGVVPNILPLFERPAFFQGFDHKGRMSPILKNTPVYAVSDALTGLYGAALAAALYHEV